jgi:hypothetical protein
MAESVINGTAGGADVKIDGTSYKTQFQQFRVVVDQPSSDATTFNDEPNESVEPGPTRAFFDASGILKKGGVGPVIPLPTNVPLIFQYSGTACTLSFTGDCTRAEAVRLVNANALLSVSGRSRSVITKAWS